MWQEMKQWLLKGAIDDDEQLATDLVAPGVLDDKHQRVWLESKKQMKKRGCDSTDSGDALCLTFAAKSAERKRPKRSRPPEGDRFARRDVRSGSLGWMG